MAVTAAATTSHEQLVVEAGVDPGTTAGGDYTTSPTDADRHVQRHLFEELPIPVCLHHTSGVDQIQLPPSLFRVIEGKPKAVVVREQGEYKAGAKSGTNLKSSSSSAPDKNPRNVILMVFLSFNTPEFRDCPATVRFSAGASTVNKSSKLSANHAFDVIRIGLPLLA
ncbi:unnamed protein product, partial [Amoebophrya sp. A120]|eukprot:GSA120T00008929001.1